MRRRGFPERIYVRASPFPDQTAALSLERNEVVCVDVLQASQHGDTSVQFGEKSQILGGEEVLELLLLILELEERLDGGAAGGTAGTERAARRHVLDVRQGEERGRLAEFHGGFVERREFGDDVEDELRLQLLRAEERAAADGLRELCEDLFDALCERGRERGRRGRRGRRRRRVRCRRGSGRRGRRGRSWASGGRRAPWRRERSSEQLERSARGARRRA